jgi:two-component system, NarL family, nitrate/nitrite response regulator NarL
MPAALEFDCEATPLRILIADDEVLTRAGIRRVLEGAGLEIAAEASNATDAIAAASAHRPDLCLLAVQMPGNGIFAAEQIRQCLPQAKIVMLTSSTREEDLFAALRAGADGFLPKTMSAQRLPSALQGVIDGEAALTRVLTARLIQEFRERGRKRRLQIRVNGQDVELTAREFEILERLRRGETTHAIAAYFRISEVTVRRHVSSIVHKLGVSDRRSAIALFEPVEQERQVATA